MNERLRKMLKPTIDVRNCLVYYFEETTCTTLKKQNVTCSTKMGTKMSVENQKTRSVPKIKKVCITCGVVTILN